MLRHKLQKLKFLEGQVECRSVQMRRIGLCINDQIADADNLLAAIVCIFEFGCRNYQAQAGIHFGGRSLVQHNIVHLPRGGNSRHSALGQDNHERDGDPRGLQKLGGIACFEQILARIQNNNIVFRADSTQGRIEGKLDHTVAEQAEGRNEFLRSRRIAQ